jgi:hypothetical protein
MGKTIEFKEKKLFSFDKAPEDPDSFFERFIKIFLSYELMAQITVAEKGPREHLKTTFQFFGMIGMTLNCVVRFEIKSSKLIVFSQFIVDITMKTPGGKKTMAKTMEGTYSPLVEGNIKKGVDQTFIVEAREIESRTRKAYEKSDFEEMRTSLGHLIFVSYATADAEMYKISELAHKLESDEAIHEVLYWQEDMRDSIIEYMSDNLGRCHLVLLFCSPNALNSVPVKKEWMAAESLNKPIVPIFVKPDHIPPLLRDRLGYEFDTFDFEKNVKDILALIKRKLE